ncbi:hypothetical protein KA183_08045 [bacterium]|nr:hypothetical protein [bacterium]
MGNFYSKLLAAAAIFFVSSSDALAYTDTPSEAINLNNRAVNRLNKGGIDEAIDLLKEALKISPTYEMASWNLSIAYNQKAQKLAANGDNGAALHLLQKSRFYYPYSQTGFENENQMLKALGYDPDSVSDRVNLANDAIFRGDIESFAAEFQEAFEIVKEKIQNDDSANEDEFYRTYGNQLASQLSRAWHPDPNSENFTIRVSAHIDSKRLYFRNLFDKRDDPNYISIEQTAKEIGPIKPLYQRQKSRLLYFLFSHSSKKNEVTFEGSERDFL